jgi:hypothetical protein
MKTLTYLDSSSLSDWLEGWGEAVLAEAGVDMKHETFNNHKVLPVLLFDLTEKGEVWAVLCTLKCPFAALSTIFRSQCLKKLHACLCASRP